ncbi:T9SS type A sorting domain-containing protein [Hymenobacter sp. BT730]|uniref:T9SS type A sorting domain-containing protein n=1 Tax=Hymenobacter sp. BT730 TaxID=3063332 RepID=UPI0026DF2FC8|nr:T9SS type A sorting domain-containing protein [Hymenobacter sp. BT730]
MKTDRKGVWPIRLGLLLLLGLWGQLPLPATAQSATAAWQWATRATSSATDPEDHSRGRFLAVDQQGNVFSSGHFYGSVALGNTTLDSPKAYDSFLVKYTPTGSVAWVQHLNSSLQETILTGLAVDAGGNCYVGGYYVQGTLIIGSTVLTGGDGFLIKYDPQGAVVWVRTAGYFIRGLDCTPAGELVALGDFRGAAVFGSTTLNSPTSSSFLVQYDPEGTPRWAQQLEGLANDEGAVALDGAGHIYVASQFQDKATFGAITLTGSTSDEDVFVARYTAAGVPEWALRQPVAGPAGDETVWGLTAHEAGGAYLVGVSYPPAGAARQWFVAQYTPAGVIGWNYGTTGTPNSALTTLATDVAGHVYVAGIVAGSLSIGGLTLTSSSNTDADIALFSFTGAGEKRWALQAGMATGTEAALGLALDRTDHFYFTGALQGNTALGSVSSPQNSISEEHFVAKATVSSVTASHAPHLAQPLQIYPNPAGGTAVNLRWAGGGQLPAQLQLQDALGRCLWAGTLPAGQTETRLPVQHLATGIYLLRLKTATTTATGRLTIE